MSLMMRMPKVASASDVNEDENARVRMLLGVLKRVLSSKGDKVEEGYRRTIDPSRNIRAVNVNIYAKWNDEDREDPTYRVKKAIEAAQRVAPPFVKLGDNTHITNDGSVTGGIQFSI